MHQTSPFTNSRCLRQAAGALRPGKTARLLVGAMLAGGVLLSAGCGPKNYLNENDKLRRQNMALKREIDELKDKLERRSGQLKVLKRRYEAPSATQPGLSEPTFSKIELGQYSGPIDTDGDGTFGEADQEPVSGRVTFGIFAGQEENIDRREVFPAP